jgi:phosphate transport system substrate-binding protein
MKRTYLSMLILIVLSVIMCVFALSACQSQKEEVVISGSSSVAPILEKVAAEYEKGHKNVRIKIETSDSGTGIADTLAGKNDIGMVSRDLKATETGLVSTQICWDAIALIAKAGTEVDSVSTQELWDLYVDGTAVQGNITKAITRESGSGTADFFNECVKNADNVNLKDYIDPNKAYGGSYCTATGIISQQNSTSAVREHIAVTAGTIGYISFGNVTSSVKVIKFNGKVPTVENIKSKDYGMVRPFNIVVKEGAALKQEAQDFITFLLSAAGQTEIEKAGCVKL